MYCPKCKSEMTDEVAFCTECGADLSVSSEEIQEGSGLVPEEEIKSESDFSEEVKEEIKEEVKEEIKEETKEDIVEEVKEDIVAVTAIPNEPVAAESPVVAAPAPVPAGPSADELKRQQQELKRQNKEAKKQAKADLKAKINDLPIEYKPLSTAKMFGFFLLSCIPVVGFIALLLFAFACKNRNFKSVARSMLLYMLIFFVISTVFTVVSFVVLGSFFADILADLPNADSVEDILYILDDLFQAY